MTVLFLAIVSSVAQTKSFKGTVIDHKDGQPVIGASVIVTDAKGKTITGVSTDLDGVFSINIPETGKEIKVSSVGFRQGRLPGQKYTLNKTLRLWMPSW